MIHLHAKTCDCSRFLKIKILNSSIEFLISSNCLKPIHSAKKIFQNQE